MTASVSFMAWPGPAHFPISPSLALRLDRRWPTQAMYQALIAQLRRDQRAGMHQVLLPPPPLAEPIMDEDPEWQEMQWRSMDIDTQTWATFWPGTDTIDGQAALVLANRSTERSGLWSKHRQGVFNQLFAKVDGIRIHQPLAGAPQLADSGSLNQLRLQVGDRHVYLLTYDDSLMLPESMRSKQLKRQSRGAILHNLQRIGLRSGHTIIARQHWKAADAGAAGLRDMCISCGDTLLLHEGACGDQHEIVTALDRLVPGIQLHIIRDGACRLRDLRQQYGLGAELFTTTGGERTLRYDPRWDDKRAQRLRNQLQAEGYVQHVEAGIDTTLSGLRHAGLWTLRADVSQAQWEQLHTPWQVTDGLLDDLDHWVSQEAWPELRVEDFADVGRVSDLRRAQERLYQLLPRCDYGA